MFLQFLSQRRGNVSGQIFKFKPLTYSIVDVGDPRRYRTCCVSENQRLPLAPLGCLMTLIQPNLFQGTKGRSMVWWQCFHRGLFGWNFLGHPKKGVGKTVNQKYTKLYCKWYFNDFGGLPPILRPKTFPCSPLGWNL